MKGKNLSSGRFFIYNFLIYLAMYPGTVFFLVFLRILDLPNVIKLFLTPSGIISILFVIMLPPFLYIRITKKLRAFQDGTLAVEDINKAVKRYEFSSIVFPIATPIIQSFFVTQQAGLWEIPGFSVSVVLIFIASTFLFSLFFYILYIQSFEKYICFVPLLPQYKSMPLVVRSILVSFFTFSAITLIFLAPLFAVLRTGDTLDAVLIQRITILVFLGALIGLGDVYFQISGTARRVGKIIDFTGAVAAGNYRCEKLEVNSRDEFGLLINDLNVFYDNTRLLLSSLNSNITDSQAAADELSKSMLETEKSVQQISDNITDVAAQISIQSGGVFETETAIEGISQNIEKLNDNIDKQAVQVAQSSAAIEEMVANVQSVTGIVEKNMNTVSSLGQAAEAGKDTVGDTVQITRRMIDASEGLLETSAVIQNIASQTNLLAMNAAIEAAHAGDIGAGFAVVSDEIRKLAEDSNQQGKTITTVLKELIDAIHEVDQSANSVQKEFEAISVLTGTVENQEKIIINAMQEQCSAGVQVLDSIRRMNEITSEVKTGSQRMKDGSSKVANEMRTLVEVTKRITKNTEDMSVETEQIKNQMRNVSQASYKTGAGIQTVALEMGKFRI